MSSKGGSKEFDAELQIAEAKLAIMSAVSGKPGHYNTLRLYREFSKEFGNKKTVQDAISELHDKNAIIFKRRDLGPGKRGEWVVYPVSTADAATGDGTDAMTFGLERDLQLALRANIAQLEHGLKIIDDNKEHSVSSGRIDILAEDHSGARVVIELKAGTADRDAIGQILAYMGDVLDQAKGKNVRGILVARDFEARAISASRAVPTIKLKEYNFTFSFKDVH
jgi:RecB family endonuclease NucS